MSTFTNIEVDRITDGIDDFFDDIINRVILVHEDQSIDFDEIRIEVWGDSGRLIAFPATKEFLKRTDIAGTQLTSQELNRTVNALSESEISDSEYEKQIDALYDSILDVVTECSKRHAFPVYTLYDEDGKTIGGTSQIVLG